jgi:transcriptional regulator with XRE-family HTH domain
MSRATVGARVASMRELKKVSVEELAQRASVTVEFVRELERDEAHPPAAILLRIARALGVRLGTFIDDRVSEDPFVVRLNEREEEITASRGKDTPAAVRFHSLGKGKSDRHMEPFFVEILEESANDESESSHEGEELLIVMSGQIEVCYAGKTTRVSAGDSIYYNSIVPHRVYAVGGGPAGVYAIFFVPA